MPLDQRERFHALNRLLAQSRIELDRAELGRTGSADRRGRRSSTAADTKPSQLAGQQEPDEGLPRDVPASLPGAGTAEAGADLRPDERLTGHLRGLAQVLPASTRAAAAGNHREPGPRTRAGPGPAWTGRSPGPDQRAMSMVASASLAIRQLNLPRRWPDHRLVA